MPPFRCSFLRSPAGAYRRSQRVSSLLARRPGKLVSSSLSAKRLRRRLNWLGAHAAVPLLVPPITSGRLSTLAEGVFSARAAPREAGVVVTLRKTAEAAAELARCSCRRSAARSSDHQRAPIDARRGCLLCSRGAPDEELAAWPRLADMASENTSRRSLWSRNSLLSIASESSILSIGSIGSVLSVGSVGSFASFGSLGSFAASLSTGSAMAHGSVMSFQSAGSVMSSQSTRAVNDQRNSGSLPGWGGAAITLGAVALSFALYLMTRRTQR